MKIAIIGKGHVGSSLGAGLARAGHEIRYGHRDPREPVSDAANWGELIIMAVPFGEVEHTVKEIGGAADGKILIDVTNPLDQNMELAIGFSTSNAENVQRMLPNARVIKAFNTVFAQNQSTARVGEHQLTAFVAGDDPDAKTTVMHLTKGMGYDPVDVGPLKSARYLEPMGIMIIGMAFKLGMGVNIGYKLLKG
ncbi:putative dinucleotide-binding enzyme [Methanolinea mesophila]|uniref:NADPH-dependent F420 reductase n=1 Tax=Methanolinea mesophila TaxID=547055 RepID=UPI001AEB47B9|nr:NADPH-dependent F420 reductase [Methanolinea mesophila]MBP1929197.1 putative dinucleotide-binding enzyme [Methanolinea mesophila]